MRFTATELTAPQCFRDAARRNGTTDGRHTRRRAASLAAPRTAEAAKVTRLGAGNWTYFSDPRAVSTETAVYTGWISPRAG